MNVRTKRQAGISLIELIVFITVVAILAVGLFKALGRTLPTAPTPQQITQATHIAQERLELIQGQKDILGFAGVIDPCVGAGAPAICTTAGYTVTVCGVNAGGGCASPPIACPAAIDSNTANCKSITVTVTGPSGTQLAQLTSLVTNF
ncbi:MAG: type IV pilus modification PilV family protein [Burkholderiales bacterium]